MHPGNILYGRHPVSEALKAGLKIEKIFLSQASPNFQPFSEIQALAKARKIPILPASREKLNQLAGTDNHQGVAGMVSSFHSIDLQELIKPEAGKPRWIVLLDHLEDPQNVGSLLRTCDAVGVSGVVIPKRRAAGLTPGTAKASAGAIGYTPLCRVGNIHQTMLQLKEEGFTLIGADQLAAQSFHEFSYPEPLALVLGNEHTGLSQLVRKTCDALVKIPMAGHLDSLNVSVAGALILYHIFLHRARPTAMP